MSIGDNNTIYQHFHSERFAPLAQKLISFSDLIEERTDGFVGRRFVSDAVDAFLRTHRSGYLVIEGEPGVGKTSLLAHLVKTRGFPHHFVVATLGVNRAEQFLESVCAQLIVGHAVDGRSWLPPEASRDGSYLAALLGQISREREPGSQIVVLVDALDEAVVSADVRENVLFLPPSLPDGVFFVVTTRPRDRGDLRLRADRLEFFTLDARSSANQADVRRYLEEFAERPAMRRRLAELGVVPVYFAESLAEKAEGNFMYLHHVLPAIEEGRLGAGGLGELPQGLRAYYDSHWRQMRATDGWLAYRQPVIVHLAAAREPIGVSQLAEWTGLSAGRVGETLRAWREFVQIEVIEGTPRYRIYHASFQDFLRGKDETREIDLADTHRRIAEHLLGTLFDGGWP
ncbi:hypothetical protein [Streptomyces sp. NPDC001604]|uniref:hypothetical protein n=1 Tax=Streptomyces sp. NPDC001604 TaxID=3364593 RepID=UPI003680A6E1